jgi:hypothetical protein
MWLSFQWWNILLVGLELPTPHKYMLVFSAELFYQVLGDVVVGNDRVVCSDFTLDANIIKICCMAHIYVCS